MTGCLESPLASPVLAQSWSQTATDGACISTTALLSGRDRPLRLCVLRPRGSEPETRRTGVWWPLPQASASSWRALASGVRPLCATNRCRVHKSANARPRRTGPTVIAPLGFKLHLKSVRKRVRVSQS